MFDGELAVKVDLDETIRVHRHPPGEIIPVEIREREEGRSNLSTRAG